MIIRLYTLVLCNKLIQISQHLSQKNLITEQGKRFLTAKSDKTEVGLKISLSSYPAHQNLVPSLKKQILLIIRNIKTIRY